MFLSYSLVFFTKAINDVKNIDVNLNKNNTSVCKILNYDGELINKISVSADTFTSLHNVSPNLINAFISIEDKKFYKHNGLNYLRIGKAFINNIKARKIKEGASTISQQLIKNKFLSNEKSIKRKVKEMYLTLKLEATEEKDSIMEHYINSIYYGNGAYGIGEASKRFFSKKPNELSLSECALLAGVVKSPAIYSPINNIDNCINRRNLVLKEMLKDNAITEEEYKNAIDEPINLNISPIMKFNNLDLYSKKAINEASKVLNVSKYEILNNGYTIYTYQNKEQQMFLDEIINDDNFYAKNEYGNIADGMSMIINNEINGITAISGRSEYDLTNFRRQPGSLIKPVLVYAPAFEEKLIYPCSQIVDEEININNYSPHNVSNKYYGKISIRDAVAKSLNVPAVKLCDNIGVEKCKQYANLCGLNFSEYDTGLSVALGGLTDGVTLEEITNSYSPFLNDGIYKNSCFVSKILSPQNLTIYTRLMTQNTYCSKDNAYLMTESLLYSTKNGTSKSLNNYNFDIASKTGTVNVKNSNLNTDAYCLAYTSNHIISAWLGNYSMDEKHHLCGSNNGGTYTTKIVNKIIENLYSKNPPDNFTIPDTIINLPVDRKTKELSGDIKLGYNIPNRYIEYDIFSTDNIPTDISDLYSSLPQIKIKNINSDTNIILEFDTLDYFDYYIYKVDNQKDILIDKISNNSGIYKYIDSNIEYNKKYKYYIIAKSPFNNTASKSNIISTSINKDYNNFLNSYNNKLNWIFG